MRPRNPAAVRRRFRRVVQRADERADREQAAHLDGLRPRRGERMRPHWRVVSAERRARAERRPKP